MTTVPLIGRRFNSARMASTAAWSAAFSSPRPRRRAAATAARSVTRTSSRVRIRSRPDGAVLDMLSNLVKDQGVAPEHYLVDGPFCQRADAAARAIRRPLQDQSV